MINLHVSDYEVRSNTTFRCNRAGTKILLKSTVYTMCKNYNLICDNKIKGVYYNI